MINGMQIISLTCLFYIRLPVNVYALNMQLLNIASFDVYQTDKFIDQFHFTETEAFSPIFEEASMDGSNFIEGIGPMFLFMIIYIAY